MNFDISVGIGAFVIGLGQISSFLSLNDEKKMTGMYENTFNLKLTLFLTISNPCLEYILNKTSSAPP